MNKVLHMPGTQNSFTINLAEETISVMVGTAFTLGLFIAMAYFELPGKKVEQEMIQDLHVISIPMEIPPPPLVQPERQAEATAITGIDVAAAESPVRIAVSLPVPNALNVPLAPPAIIRTSSVMADFKPKMDLATDFQHVFQLEEVDRKPYVLVNTNPHIPTLVRNNVDQLGVVLLMIINVDGTANNIRILKPSGNERFDKIVVECVRDEWVFSPAMKKGRNVKCMVQRSITVKWTSSHFET